MTVTENRPTTTTPHFGTLTPRMAAWREELMETTPSVCAERAVLTTEAYKAHQHEPMVLRRALMVDNVLRHMSIYIEPATLIAGNQASANRAAPIMPEYAMDWVIAELDEFDKRPGDRFTITEEGGERAVWRIRHHQRRGALTAMATAVRGHAAPESCGTARSQAAAQQSRSPGI